MQVELAFTSGDDVKFFFNLNLVCLGDESVV